MRAHVLSGGALNATPGWLVRLGDDFSRIDASREALADGGAALRVREPGRFAVLKGFAGPASAHAFASQQTALELFKANPRIDFSDCMILEVARKAGHVPLGTFDRRLAKLDDTESL